MQMEIFFFWVEMTATIMSLGNPKTKSMNIHIYNYINTIACTSHNYSYKNVFAKSTLPSSTPNNITIHHQPLTPLTI